VAFAKANQLSQATKGVDVHISFKSARAIVVAAISAAALSAAFAGSALAATPASWNVPDFTAAKATTTGITVKKNGASPVACTQTGTQGGNVVGKGAGLFESTSFGMLRQTFSCAGGTSFHFYLTSEAGFAEGAARWLTLSSWPTSLPSPYGAFAQDAHASPTYTNGTAKTPSTINFSNTVVGHQGGGATISITGSFNATTSTGGLLTLN
jgi:hypothetical protein